MYMSSIEYFRSGVDKPKRTPEEALENVRQFIKERLDEISKDPEIIEGLKVFKETITAVLNGEDTEYRVGDEYQLVEGNVISYQDRFGLYIKVTAEGSSSQSLANDLAIVYLTLIERKKFMKIGAFPVTFIAGDGEVLFRTVIYPVSLYPKQNGDIEITLIETNEADG